VPTSVALDRLRKISGELVKEDEVRPPTRALLAGRTELGGAGFLHRVELGNPVCDLTAHVAQVAAERGRRAVIARLNPGRFRWTVRSPIRTRSARSRSPTRQ